MIDIALSFQFPNSFLYFPILLPNINKTFLPYLLHLITSNAKEPTRFPHIIHFLGTNTDNRINLTNKFITVNKLTIGNDSNFIDEVYILIFLLWFLFDER